MSHTSMLIFSEDIFSDSAIANPYPVYAKMRAQGQIVWLETHKIWAAVGYQAAADILRQSKIFISGRGLSLNDKVNQHLIGSTQIQMVNVIAASAALLQPLLCLTS